MDKKQYKNNQEYPESELTEKIIKCAFLVYRQLGYGLPEKTYQAAYAKSLTNNKLRFSREKYGKILFDNEIVGRYYLDFFIENKVAVEFKVRNDIYQTDTIQLLNYLKSENIRVGLLILFTGKGLKIKRLANSPQR